MKIIISIFFLFPTLVFSAQAKKDAVTVEIYAEPFDSKGIGSFLYFDSIKRKIKKINLKFYPLIYKNQNGSFYSSRGEVELTEAARIETIIEKLPSKIGDYLFARTLSTSYDGWKDACIYAQINPHEIDSYLNSNRNNLLESIYKRILTKNISEFSVFINSKKYEGDISLISFIEEINSYLNDKEKFNLYKKELSMIKPPDFKIIYNADTKQWIDENTVNAFKRFFPNIKSDMLNFDDIPDEWKSEIKMLPAYLIEKTQAVNDLFSNAGSNLGLGEVGNFYIYYNQNSNNLILSKEKNPKKLEVFVMSQCPFGVMAMNSIIDAIENKKISSDISFDIHYIGDIFKDADGNMKFYSLHGDDEWMENARQLFIKNKFPDKYFAYLKERNKNYSSNNWKDAAIKAQIDPEIIEKNFEEAKKLLEKDFAYTNSYGISVSPTFIVDGNIIVVGLGNLKKIEYYKDIEIKENASSGGCGK